MARGTLPAEWALAPLDWLRTLALRRLGPHLRGLLRDRSARVSVLGAGSVACALLLAVALPLHTLSVIPLVLGVAHLLGDVRYLMVRQGLHRRRALSIGIALCLAIGTLGAPLLCGAGAVAIAAVLARGSMVARGGVLGACGLFAALAYHHGHVMSVLFAHAHNLVALAVWCVWARSRRALVPALVGAALASVAIAVGAFDGALLHALRERSDWSVAPAVLEHTLTLTRDPIWAWRALAFFAFAQSLHYAVWLKLVPEEDRARRGVRSFRASYRALADDVGGTLPVAAIVMTLGLCLYALHDLTLARASYLQFAAFHGPLELALLAVLGLESRGVRRAGGRHAT